jgi:Retroviral aspartyl protease
MHALRTLPGSALFPTWPDHKLRQTFTIYHDAPALTPGQLAANALPCAVQALHSAGQEGGLTFIFSCMLAGLPASILWNSGATESFISSVFAARHELCVRVERTILQRSLWRMVRPLSAKGTVQLKLRIQGYCSTQSFSVIDLPCFYEEHDVRLCNSGFGFPRACTGRASQSGLCMYVCMYVCNVCLYACMYGLHCRIHIVDIDTGDYVACKWAWVQCHQRYVYIAVLTFVQASSVGGPARLAGQHLSELGQIWNGAVWTRITRLRDHRLANETLEVRESAAGTR